MSPKSVQKRARVHHKTVTAVSKGEVEAPKRRRTGQRKSSRVQHGRKHPALVMAHALGIDPARVEVTAEPPLWGCVIHNNSQWRSNDQ